MLDYLAAIASESNLFNRALQSVLHWGEAQAPTMVPSCPEWTAADLVWHLSEVQHFWGSIVEGSLTDPGDAAPLARPADDELIALHADRAAALVAALTDRDPSQPCWSWDGGMQDIAWVLRRQAQEALIHRIDAELTAFPSQGVGSGERAPIDEDLAADGVDEMLRVMLDVGDELPEWATFETDGTTVQLDVPGRGWLLQLGAMTGTDPDGAAQDLPAIRILDHNTDQDAGGGRAPTDAAARISGPASTLDLWLWRRDGLEGADVSGDQRAVDRLHRIADFG